MTLRWKPFENHGLQRVETDGKTCMGPKSMRWLDDGPLPCVGLIGAFDGFHKGHQHLVDAACRDARTRGLPCVAITFDPDPAEVLAGDRSYRRLLSCEDRAVALVGAGVDVVIAFSFDEGFAKLQPEEFITKSLLGNVSLASLHVGENFRFGCRGAGDVSTLRESGKRHGFDVHVHELLSIAGLPVSATRVRSCLVSSCLADANELLGRCHYVRGDVAHGRGEGAKFGFPTANVVCDARDCLPAEGVYACYVSDGMHAWPAAANVGAPPTFSSHRDSFLEANLLGYSGNMYGKSVSVSFVEFLRPSREFSSLEELQHVVLGNIDWVGEHLGTCEIDLGAGQ